jgi:hypothetical protein
MVPISIADNGIKDDEPGQGAELLNPLPGGKDFSTATMIFLMQWSLCPHCFDFSYPRTRPDITSLPWIRPKPCFVSTKEREALPRFPKNIANSTRAAGISRR